MFARLFTMNKIVKKCAVENCAEPVRAKGLCCKHHHRWRRHGDPLGGVAFQGQALLWLEEHKTFDGTDCLLWPFGKLPLGYGAVYKDGKNLMAHRVMCEYRNGPPPTPKHQAAHNCGKGHLGCVNPTHVSWKTCTDNHADKIIHGTSVRGERNCNAKLTRENVRAIRSTKGYSQDELGRRYGVSGSVVSSIKRGVTWAWLD